MRALDISEETQAQLRRVRFTLAEVIAACLVSVIIGYALGFLTPVTIDIHW